MFDTPYEVTMSWGGPPAVACSDREDLPMTLHIVMFTADLNGMVWVSERGAFLGTGPGNFATLRKVTHIKEHGIAFSGWGDLTALRALMEFEDRIRDGRFSLTEADKEDEETVRSKLRNFANDVLPNDKRGPVESADCRGMIVCTLGKMPRAYRLNIVWQPICFAIHDELHIQIGDASNPANLFVRYYYPRCQKTTRELLKLGLHTMRLARELNAAVLGDADAWVCENGDFRQLGPEELANYKGLSRDLDSAIFDWLKL
jgi:hypothetical protein